MTTPLTEKPTAHPLTIWNVICEFLASFQRTETTTSPIHLPLTPTTSKIAIPYPPMDSQRESSVSKNLWHENPIYNFKPFYPLNKPNFNGKNFNGSVSKYSHL